MPSESLIGQPPIAAQSPDRFTAEDLFNTWTAPDAEVGSFGYVRFRRNLQPQPAHNTAAYRIRRECLSALEESNFMKTGSVFKKNRKILRSLYYDFINYNVIDRFMGALLNHPKVFRLYRDNEINLLLDSNSLVDRNILQLGHWERAQIRFLLKNYNKTKKPGAKNIFIDVGAYFGLYSLKAFESKYFDEIHAFEPDTYNRYQLYANLFLNKAHNSIVVHPALVSDEADLIVKTEPSTSHPTGNRGGVGINSSTKECSTARTDTLDNMFDFSGQNLCVKIDVEGHELHVLQGALQLLKNNNSLIQVESFPENSPAVFDLMQVHGFKHVQSIAVDHYFVRATGRRDALSDNAPGDPV